LAAIDKDDLEQRLQTRTEELDMAMSDLHVVEETIHLLDEEKMQLIAELEHARDLFV